MRFKLRGILSGCCTLGLAFCAGCGTATDDALVTAYEAGAQAPRLLDGPNFRQGHPIAHDGGLAPAWPSDAGVLPTAGRSPSRGFVVQPAEPIADATAPPRVRPTVQPTVQPAQPAAQAIAPREEIELVVPEDVVAAPVMVGGEDPPAPDGLAESLFAPGSASGAANRFVPNAPHGWPLESRLAETREQFDDGHNAGPVVVEAPYPLVRREPVVEERVADSRAANVPIPESDLSPQVPIDGNAGELTAPDTAPYELPVAPEVEAEGPRPTLAEPVDEAPLESPLTPAPEDAAPLRPILVTPESDRPDSHWPSTMVPLPPVDGPAPVVTEAAPLPEPTAISSAPEAPSAKVRMPEQAAPAADEPERELATAEQGRPDSSVGPTRSTEMEAVSRLAFSHVQNGFALAQRSALFAARSQFIQALRLLAEAKDTEQHTREHSQALAAGLRAIEEADDFALAGSQLEGNVDLEVTTSGHRTPALDGADFETITVTVALQRYLTYAQEQLAAAAPEEPVASMALYGLGKVHATLARHPSTNVKAPEPKAMVFHQAALLVDRRNYPAANDLGVLLVRLGRLPDAREAFLYSLGHQSQVHVWNNLAAVHRHLGETVLAGQAQQEAQALAQHGAPQGAVAATSPTAVRWVEPSEFTGETQTAQRPEESQNAEPAKPAGPRKVGALDRIMPSRGGDKSESNRK